MQKAYCNPFQAFMLHLMWNSVALGVPYHESRKDYQSTSEVHAEVLQDRIVCHCSKQELSRYSAARPLELMLLTRSGLPAVAMAVKYYLAC